MPVGAYGALSRAISASHLRAHRLRSRTIVDANFAWSGCTLASPSSSSALLKASRARLVLTNVEARLALERVGPGGRLQLDGSGRVLRRLHVSLQLELRRRRLQ